jgi:hypothetical protein
MAPAPFVLLVTTLSAERRLEGVSSEQGPAASRDCRVATLLAMTFFTLETAAQPQSCEAMRRDGSRQAIDKQNQLGGVSSGRCPVEAVKPRPEQGLRENQ